MCLSNSIKGKTSSGEIAVTARETEVADPEKFTGHRPSGERSPVSYKQSLTATFPPKVQGYLVTVPGEF